MGSTPLQIRFDETDGFIKIHDGTRYLQIFSNSLYDKICDRIKYLISKKKMVSQIVLIIVLKELEVIRIILDLLKKY